MAIVEVNFMVSEITIEQSHQQLYDACKSLLVMIEWFEELQLEVEYARIDSPRLIAIRQAVLNAQELLKEMSDGDY